MSVTVLIHGVYHALLFACLLRVDAYYVHNMYRNMDFANACSHCLCMYIKKEVVQFPGFT